jgi:hypothetical protein
MQGISSTCAKTPNIRVATADESMAVGKSLVVKNHAQEAAMDGQFSIVIVDKAMLPEPVHEMTYP